jgi:hypothetical protein
LLASQASDWLVLLLLFVATTPAILFHRGILTVVPRLNLLDDSWLLDTSYKAAGGIWLGRDVAFTYGPLFQWLSSASFDWISVVPERVTVEAVEACGSVFRKNI